MELWDMEREKARQSLAAHGKTAEDFTIERSFLPPDPDGGGMFTVQYEVTVTDTRNDKAVGAIGGIGFDWVAVLDEALAEGHFD